MREPLRDEELVQLVNCRLCGHLYHGDPEKLHACEPCRQELQGFVAEAVGVAVREAADPLVALLHSIDNRLAGIAARLRGLP